jgi:hypothetical protein
VSFARSDFDAWIAKTALLDRERDLNMRLWLRQLACRCRGQMLAPIYRVYEHRLLQQVRAFPVPRHIGLILDGNRRFGRLNGLRHPDDIYMAGANKLDDLLDWCIDLEIPVITLWVFSTEIRKRPAQEVTGILAAVEKKLRSSHLTGSSIADESACARLVVSNCCRRLRSQPCAQQKLQRKATVACI